MKHEEKCHAGKDRDGNAYAVSAVMIYLGNQVACGDIKRDTASYRKSVRNGDTRVGSYEIEDQGTQQGRTAEQRRGPNNLFQILSRRKDHRTDRESFGKFMQEYG